ncbi:radical SAM protein [Microseira sp. BLCC-F43]|jgi:MoaA/NifB/PqqE/SkfB family radical SAM enzyme|uniref:radical SAM protein n=1 Tax=Microseira sp. BLCC-F43 TaxID=3153602 RepID=UPI0035BA6446
MNTETVKAELYTGLTNTLANLFQTPQYIILFVTDVCWMRCRHCWFNEEWKDRELTSNALTFDEYEKLADSIDQIKFLSLTGGEAFHRDDIVELATMFRRKTKLARYQIPTSGYKTDRIVAATERLLQANPDTPFRVDVSLDGVGEVHNHIRRISDGYDRACNTIIELNKLKQHYKHFDVGVITTISHANQETVEEIGAVVEKIHPEGEWMINITRGTPRDPKAIDVDIEAYKKAHQIIERRIAEGRYRGHGGHLTAKWLSAKNFVRRQVISDIVEGKRSGGGCAAGSLGGVIYSDGSVKVCEMLDKPLGNIRDFNYDLAALWNSEAARSLRRFIQESRCQCTQECFLSVSMLIQPDTWPGIVRERMKLGWS